MSSVDVFGAEETKYFYELTPSHILDATEKLGFRTTGRIIQLNSMENRVYEVQISFEGDEDLPLSSKELYRIIKFYRPGRWNEAQILEEHSFLQDLANDEVPVVPPVAIDGKTLFYYSELGLYFSIFPKALGRSPDELKTEQLVTIGRALARLHITAGKHQALHRITLTPQIWGRQNLDFLSLTDLIPEHIKSRYQDCVLEIIECSEKLFDNIPLQRIHGDLHFGNILWGSEGLFFVDFDDMAIGSPVQDLWLITPGRDHESRIQQEFLLDAYQELRSFDRSSLELIEPLRALRFLHFSAWIGKRWNDPAFPRTFPHYGTVSYWNEQLADLEEIKELIKS